MGDLVVDAPTFTDLKWWHETGAPDTFSNTMYEAIQDFENFLFNQVKDLIGSNFSEQDKDTREKLIKAICRLTRCVPAGVINANQILDPSGSKKPWIGASDGPYRFDPSPRDDDKSNLRVLILGLLEQSTDDAGNLSGLFEIENANAKPELVAAPGISTFMRSMYHNTVRSDNIYRLIQHFEDELSGLIQKEPDLEKITDPALKALARETTFTETTGCESIYVAKSMPHGFLAMLEGWSKSPIGGNTASMSTFATLRYASIKSNSDLL